MGSGGEARCSKAEHTIKCMTVHVPFQLVTDNGLYPFQKLLQLLWKGLHFTANGHMKVFKPY